MNTTDYNESEPRAFTKSSKIKHLENLRRVEEAQETTTRKTCATQEKRAQKTQIK